MAKSTSSPRAGIPITIILNKKIAARKSLVFLRENFTGYVTGRCKSLPVTAFQAVMRFFVTVASVFSVVAEFFASGA